MRRWLPSVAGVTATIAGAAFGYGLVADDLAQRKAVGFTGSGQYRFVIFMALACGALGYLLFRRILRGPAMVRETWALYRAPGPVEVVLPTLVEGLRRWGYAPVLSALGDASRVEPDRALLRQAGVRHGGVEIDLSSLGSRGIATVEAIDTGNELYTELAQYFLYELGRSVPGITFRGATSSLTAESTDTLEPLLPERPHYLKR